MKPIEFIYTHLEDLSKEFPQVHIKYAFNKIIFTHIIELLPLTEYQNNSALDDAWIPLSFDFRKLFPDDEIAFVSSDSTLTICDPLFEFNVPQEEFACMDEIFAELSEDDIKYTFPTYIPSRIMPFKDSVNRVLSYPEVNFDDFDDFDNSYQQAA
jgi:hypothetical protein